MIEYRAVKAAGVNIQALTIELDILGRDGWKVIQILEGTDYPYEIIAWRETPQMKGNP